jgi:hypothetical protein
MVARCPIASRAYIIIYINDSHPAESLPPSGCRAYEFFCLLLQKLPPPATDLSSTAGMHTYFAYLRQVFILIWFSGVPPVFMDLRPIAAPLVFLKCKGSNFTDKSTNFSPIFYPKIFFPAAHTKNRETPESRELPIAPRI